MKLGLVYDVGANIRVAKKRHVTLGTTVSGATRRRFT
jgi:hypothetical protein